MGRSYKFLPHISHIKKLRQAECNAAAARGHRQPFVHKLNFVVRRKGLLVPKSQINGMALCPSF